MTLLFPNPNQGGNVTKIELTNLMTVILMIGRPGMWPEEAASLALLVQTRVREALNRRAEVREEARRRSNGSPGEA